jgi:hypothetical protein
MSKLLFFPQNLNIGASIRTCSYLFWNLAVRSQALGATNPIKIVEERKFSPTETNEPELLSNR